MPVSVLDSPNYRGLSHVAARILVMLHYQYRGNNNGDISAPLSLAEQWGVKSSATLAKALRELEKAGLIIRTRDPTRDRKSPHGMCSLFAITWEPMDESPKHTCRRTEAPIRCFALDK
ncbi:MAG: MarR family transcriptional regulator [Cellvibrionaceae bacterium]|nr:MarR family transcriptional regulator [Cellvibrionaceae bacterium]